MDRIHWTFKLRSVNYAQFSHIWNPRTLIPLALINGTAGAFAFVVYLRYAPLPQGALINPTRVAAVDGQVIGDLIASGVTRQEVSLQQVPIYLQEATIAVEDANFYSHSGLNLKGITRALLANLGAGHVVQGGSTITQQLAKNLFLSGDRTLWRKLREAVYALQLELHYPKKQILTDYLNVIYYGDGATGIGMAAKYYFGRSVNTLDLAESALLAGLPKGPSLYSPLTHFTAAKERQRIVLQSMVRAGYLSQSAAHSAFLEPLHFAHHHSQESIAPYFTDAVTAAAKKQLHLTNEDIYRNGLSIHTPLDPLLQGALNRAIKRYIPVGSGLQVAAVVMDPHNGNIEAYSGGANYATSPYDRVNALRQPGSAFKPFVYAAALDHGFTAAMHMKSAPRTFHYDSGQREYLVHNFADDYTYSEIDMRQAIARSDNIFAVSANLAVGPGRVIQTAEDFGLPTNMKPYPSLALGVFPVSVLEMARAYSVFANGGYLVKPHWITRVIDSTGHILYQSEPARLLVESPSTAYILTDLMKSVMRPGGTGYRVARTIPGTIAAKTGTTDTDAWIAGYTPNTVCVVWVGYDRMKLISATDAHRAAPIFAAVMKEVFHEHPQQGRFTKPSDVVSAWIDPQSGQRATSACPSREEDFFATGTEPSATCLAHPEPAQSVSDHALNVLRSLWSWIRGRH